MPSTPRIRQQPGNQIPEQRETRTRAGGEISTSIPTIDDVERRAPTGGASVCATAHTPACLAPDSAGRSAVRQAVWTSPVHIDAPSGDDDLKTVVETDRPLVEAMCFFDAPDAEPQIPLEQMIYTPVEDTYAFRSFPDLPVLATSQDRPWRSVQLNLTHDGALGAALVLLACDPNALEHVISASDVPGQYRIRLKLPAQGGGVLPLETVVDDRVPASENGHILGRTPDRDNAPLWPLIVAKGMGKLVRVLRASGHLPSYNIKPALAFAQFHMWLTGRAPQAVTDLRSALQALASRSAPAMVMQAPGGASPEQRVEQGTITTVLSGMARRLRSDTGHIDVLLLHGHHYGVVEADDTFVTLYNPLGFNPQAALADGPDGGFFDPHSLSSAGTVGATVRLPIAWLQALDGRWFY